LENNCSGIYSGGLEEGCYMNKFEECFNFIGHVRDLSKRKLPSYTGGRDQED
jgi:hypothetical protein